jgi:hypothetical protein
MLLPSCSIEKCLKRKSRHPLKDCCRSLDLQPEAHSHRWKSRREFPPFQARPALAQSRRVSISHQRELRLTLPGSLGMDRWSAATAAREALHSR